MFGHDIDKRATVSGKIRRVELRQAEATRVYGTTPQNEFREDDFPEIR
jgi:hypothetical protein